MKLKKHCQKPFKILQMDGGGIMGTMFLVFLDELEKKLGRKCSEIFDCFIGTSTGGIAGAMLAAGCPSGDVLDLYKTKGKKIFKKRFLGFLNPTSWFSGQYDRKYIDGLCDKLMNQKMSRLKKQFIVTAVNMHDTKSTHFIKSFKAKYRNKKTGEMVKRTYSAPTYFGYYKDSEGLWSDGGVGVQTCTLMESYIEALRQGYDNQYWILSLGTGYTDLKNPKAGKFLGAQIADFIPIAREQSINSQVRYAIEMNLNFNRVNVKINQKHAKMDAVKYIPCYIDYGKQMVINHLKDIAE